jgi:hypothetical protein
MTSDLLARYGLDLRLVEWFKAADHGQCHCGKPGIYVEQRANTWLWYCPDHRPSFRVCHICGQPGVSVRAGCRAMALVLPSSRR